MATLFIFTITGQIVWSYFAWRFVSRLVRIMIFMYRMGWKEVRSIYIRDWIDIIINPPDKLGATYYPGKRGKEMRQRDEHSVILRNVYREHLNRAPSPNLTP